MTGYPRDLVGYADQPPDPRWPGGARLAVNFVVNYEEGGERSVLHGDKVAETRLSDLVTGCTAFCASSVRPMDRWTFCRERSGVARTRPCFGRAKPLQ